MLTSGSGDSFELVVVGYQFPEIDRGEWDANWLMVEGRASEQGREWTFRQPCLRTLDLASLADWLEALGGGLAPRSDWWVADEPLLRFDWLRSPDGSLDLTISFAFEGRPSWRSQPAVSIWSGCMLRFAPSSRDLMNMAASLRAEMVRFPPRGDWEGFSNYAEMRAARSKP